MQIKESEESKVGEEKKTEKKCTKNRWGKPATQIYAELRDGGRKDKEMGPNPHKQLPAIPGKREEKQTV